MPAKAPPSGKKIEDQLREIGKAIRARRKELGVSASAVAESASMSRPTLYKIEAGASSVAMAAYLNVLDVLHLKLAVMDMSETLEAELPEKIRVGDYPQLKKLSWQLKKTQELSPAEVLEVYEKNWKFLDLNEMSPDERELVQKILKAFGRRRLLV